MIGEELFVVGAIVAIVVAVARKHEVSPPPATRATLMGTVSDITNDAPIEGALVDLAGNQVLTDADGAYSFSGLAAGNYEVRASKSGYETVIY